MAQAKKCDRCGGLYESKPIKYDGGETFNGVALVTRESDNTIHYTTAYKDLCPRCVNDFITYLKKGKHDA